MGLKMWLEYLLYDPVIWVAVGGFVLVMAYFSWSGQRERKRKQEELERDLKNRVRELEEKLKKREMEKEEG